MGAGRSAAGRGGETLMEAVMQFVRLCHADDIAEGQSRGFDPWKDGQDSVMVIRQGGRLHAWRDACPHHGGTPMAWWKDHYLNAASTRIVCASHGAQFDIETGECTLGPCLGQKLRKVRLVVTGEREVCVSAEEEETA
jgi:nitrite reductase/ring-hydroxylating ferredoxin subunit